MNSEKQQTLEINQTHSKMRLDAFLALHEPTQSRSVWKSLIQDQCVTVNGGAAKPNLRLKQGDTVAWTLPEAPSDEPMAEEVAFSILYEDEAILVISKPAGLVVHPAAGNLSGTLLNGLLFHDPVFSAIDRAGIVHRLDKETSGVMVIGKTAAAIEHLQAQFKNRETEKEYRALVWGDPPRNGRIETQLGRHPAHRKKQAVVQEEGRLAITNFKKLEQFSNCALLSVEIETGRTHQIRVHMTHLRHPVIGDKVYGRSRNGKLPSIPKRQMLHAARLGFTHPTSGKRLSFEAPLLDDMELLLQQLRDA